MVQKSLAHELLGHELQATAVTMDWAARVRHPEERVGEELLGKWRLDELLGIGAMAAVFSATHRNGKRVAIKLLHQHLAGEAVIVQRFLREGYASNRVGHPAVVSVLDDNVTKDGVPFLVMDFVDGKPLDRLLQQRGAMRWPVVLRMADQVLDALAAAHDKGVLHRDLKPENLLVTEDGVVRILDFGIARVEDKPGDPRLTLQGRAMGTPGFMAPEQAQGMWDRVDARSDLWSLGATMFAALTGREVHVATKAHELLIACMTKPVQPLHEVLPDIPKSVANIVDRAVSYDPGNRFPSARVMQEWVREAIPAPPPMPSIPSVPDGPHSQAPAVVPVPSDPPLKPRRERGSRWGLMLLGAAALATTAFFAAPVLRRGRPTPAELYRQHFERAWLAHGVSDALARKVDDVARAMPEPRQIDVDQTEDVEEILKDEAGDDPPAQASDHVDVRGPRWN